MTTIDVVDASGASTGSLDLPGDLFDAQANIPLIHQVVVGQLAAARQGTHSTLTRGEVSGGGRKPYRQKGTGRARQGSIRAPQFAGGGVVHGPTPHKYDQRTPKKMKAAALRGALSDRARDGRIHVVESFVEGEKPSTKTAVQVLSRLTERPRTLVVVQRDDTVTVLSLRNVSRIHVLWVDQLNTYDVLASDDVVFTRGAYEDFVAARSTGESTRRTARRATQSGGAADAAGELQAQNEELAAVADQEPRAVDAASSTVAEPAEVEPASAGEELGAQNDELSAVAEQVGDDSDASDDEGEQA